MYKINLVITLAIALTITNQIQLYEEIQNEVCDLETDNNICIMNQNLVIQPKHIDEDVIGYWSFDDNYIQNAKNNNLNVQHKNLEIMPGIQGINFSAGFNYNSYFLVQNINNISNSYSISFSIFLQQIKFEKQLQSQEPEALIFPLLQKFQLNVNNDDEIQMDIKLSILPETQKIEIQFSQFNYQNNQIELFKETSNSKLQSQKWTYINIQQENNILTLWINGFKDTIIIKDQNQSQISDNSVSTLLFGTQQDQVDSQNFIQFQIDELQIRNKVLSDSHITAVGEFYLNGISPKLYYLEGLNLQHNQIACEKYKNYHICNNLELLSGGYQLAHLMGWIDTFQNKIWSYEGIYEIRSQNQNENQNQNLSGLALCCLDLNQSQ